MLSALLASGDAPSLLDTLGVSIPVVVLQICVFVTTFLVLSNGLFTRVLRRMQEREEEVAKGQAGVERDRAEPAKVSHEYQEQLAKIDRSAYERAQSLIREAMASAGAVVAQAQ